MSPTTLREFRARLRYCDAAEGAVVSPEFITIVRAANLEAAELEVEKVVRRLNQKVSVLEVAENDTPMAVHSKRQAED